jgi:hypothetical protein
MFSDNILLTANVKRVTNSGIVLNEGKGEILTRQTVVCCGPASCVEVGDEVEIDTSRFQRKNLGPKRVGEHYDTGPDRFEVVLPIEVFDNEPYLFVSTRELKYAYEKGE